MDECEPPIRVHRRHGASSFDDIMGQLFGRVECVRWAWKPEKLGMYPQGRATCDGLCPAPQPGGF